MIASVGDAGSNRIMLQIEIECQHKRQMTCNYHIVSATMIASIGEVIASLREAIDIYKRGGDNNGKVNE